MLIQISPGKNADNDEQEPSSYNRKTMFDYRFSPVGHHRLSLLTHGYGFMIAS